MKSSTLYLVLIFAIASHHEMIEGKYYFEYTVFRISLSIFAVRIEGLSINKTNAGIII